jgi:hypothetical protein
LQEVELVQDVVDADADRQPAGPLHVAVHDPRLVAL